MSVAIPTTLPTTVPSTSDIYVQLGKAIEQTGLAETFLHTPLSKWLLAALAVFLGMLGGKIASTLLRRYGARAAERVKLVRAVLFNSVAGPLSLFLTTIGMVMAIQFINLSPTLRDFVVRLLQLLNIISIGWLLYNLVDVLTLALNRWTRGRQGNLSVMLVPLARKTLRVMLVTVLLLFVAENVFNQDVKALLAGLGIAGLAVSLAAQDSIRNLFGSITIFADQPFAIGEFIEVGGFKGTVEDIGFRSTRIRTLDGYLLTMPNSKVADSPVQNNSRRTKIRRVVEIGLPGDSAPQDIERVLTILRQILDGPDLTKAFDSETDPVRIAFDEMQGNLLRVKAFYWFQDGNYWEYLAHAQKVNLEIVRRLSESQIKFSFP